MSNHMTKLKDILGYARAFALVGISDTIATVNVRAGADNTNTAAPNHGADAINAVLSILYLVANIVGIIFIAVGIVRFAMSHAQEDGPGQQKAIMMMATGVVLLVVRFVLSSLHVETWISTAL